MKKTILRAAALSVLALFMACTNALDPTREENASVPANGKGIARINIGGKTAQGRTLMPDHMAIYYILTFTKGSNTVPAVINNSTVKEVELDPGTWTLDIKGYPDRAAFETAPQYPGISGKVSAVVINPGQSTNVPVTLTAAQTEYGAGWISFDLSFPDRVDRGTLTIQPLLGAASTPPDVDLLNATYQADAPAGTKRAAGKVPGDIASGFYRLSYTLTITGSPSWFVIRSMVVHVYDDLVSPLVAAYGLEDFTAFRPITSLADLTAYLKDMPANTPETAYEIALEGFDFAATVGPGSFGSAAEPLKRLYNAIYDETTVRYVSLDLSACLGDIPNMGTAERSQLSLDPLTRHGRDRLVALILPDTTKSIGSDAFSYCSNLVSVDLPRDLETIGPNAFYHCVLLAEFDIGELSVLKTLGDNAFMGVPGYKTLTLPASVTSIGVSVFNGWTNLEELDLSALTITSLQTSVFAGTHKLTSIILPAGLKTIGNTVFSATGLTELDLSGYGITSIGTNAFENCQDLEKVTLPATLTTLGTLAFSGCSALTELDLSACTNMSAVNTAFSNCPELTELDLSTTKVSTVPARAFSGDTKLAALRLPATLTTMDAQAFFDTQSVTSSRPKFYTAGGAFSVSADNTLLIKTAGANVTLVAGPAASGALTVPNGITYIGNYAFRNNTALTGLVLPEGLKQVGQYAFQNTGAVGSLTLPSTLETIDAYGFENALGQGITILNLPAGLKTLGASAFQNNKYLVTINWPVSPSGTTIGAGAFNNGTGGSALTAVVLPSGVASLPVCLTGNPLLTTVDISACTGLTSIGTFFRDMTNLTTLDLSGTGVTTLAENAFTGTSLASLKLPAVLTTVDARAFAGLTNLVFDASAASNFTTAESGKWLLNAAGTTLRAAPGASGHITISGGITAIGDYAFVGGDSSNPSGLLTGITLPNTVTSVGNRIVYNQAGFTTFIWNGPVSGATLAGAFGSSVLNTVTLPEGLTALPGLCFYRVSSLTSSGLTLPSSLTTIGQMAFDGATGLTGVLSLPNVTTIDSEAFKGCTGLTGLDLPKIVTLSANAFNGCTGLTKITLPATLKTLSGFSDCTELLWVKWPASPSGASVTADAFYNCPKLAKVELPNNLNTTTSPYAIGHRAFQSSPIEVLIIRTAAASTPAYPRIYYSYPATSTIGSVPARPNMKIYVPDASLATYKSITNTYSWVNHSGYLYSDSNIATDGNDPLTW
jgi:Leucine-rich repeat (LRR) protein